MSARAAKAKLENWTGTLPGPPRERVWTTIKYGHSNTICKLCERDYNVAIAGRCDSKPILQVMSTDCKSFPVSPVKALFALKQGLQNSSEAYRLDVVLSTAP